MKFEMNNKTMIEHVMLQDIECCKKIAETSLWKDSELLEAHLTINGVTVPAENLEKVLLMCWEQANEAVGNREYEQDVKAAARKMVEDFNWDLTNTITNFCETYDFDKEED